MVQFIGLPADGAADIVRSRFDYDADTGKFFHRFGRCAGQQAGGNDGQGYIALVMGPYRVKAHRAAWAYCYGNLPDGPIDHINGDRKDNRISNLRIATPKANRENQHRARSDSATGLLGVLVRGTRFVAVIKVDGRKQYHGTFGSPQEAHAAAINAKRISHSGFAG
jgi:hypothetical protein